VAGQLGGLEHGQRRQRQLRAKTGHGSESVEHLAGIVVTETVEGHGVFLDHHRGQDAGVLPAGQAT